MSGCATRRDGQVDRPAPSYGRAVARDDGVTAGVGVARREVVDHALQRRAALVDLRTGRVSRWEACDASPYLVRAAERLGVAVDRPCPVCRSTLREVLWVYGAAVGDADGTARTPGQVEALARAHPDLAVYEVEVCPSCGWNCLLRTWRTGTPGTPAARRSRRTAADP